MTELINISKDQTVILHKKGRFQQKKHMLSHTGKSQLVAVGVNAAIFVGLTTALLPLFFLFATLVGEPPIWQRIVWYTIFPLAGLPWPESVSSVFFCFLLNAILWGTVIQFIIRLRSLKRSRV
ncbi:hypothetical protein [Spirosoma fluviale]|uniref:hypothetical protein n=1 Tax=Spirosoma fluviale TaxID=1597977 RepID=UPI000BE314D9|nr:hypothetical protein [Spirosoma fluviale]